MCTSVPLRLNSLEDLLLRQIEVLYDTEHEVTELLPRFGDATGSDELRDAFRRFFKSAQAQILRLESAFDQLGYGPGRATSYAAAGLVQDCEEVLEAEGDPVVKDAALVAAVRRVRQQELAGYMAAAGLAEQLDHKPLQTVLRQAVETQTKADETFFCQS